MRRGMDLLYFRKERTRLIRQYYDRASLPLIENIRKTAALRTGIDSRATVENEAIAARCTSLGLSLTQVRRLAGVDHSLADLAFVLGLDPLTMKPLKQRRWLWMAAQTCSVSYQKPLTPDGLLEILTTGELPPADSATFLHFLDEAPLTVVVMAIEQASQLSSVPIERIWHHVDKIAAAWSSTRLRSITVTS